MKRHFLSWPRSKNTPSMILLALGLGLGILTFLDGYYLNWRLTGFGSKTLWDWLGLSIVPTIICFGAFLFNRSENNETALQGYLDQMSVLLLDKDNKLDDPKEGNRARAVAQARTSTILRRLDGNRKAEVLLFLQEAKLINKDSAVIDLRNSNLTGLILNDATLRDANLEEVDLRHAELRNSDLRGAKIAKARLIGAYLYNADLRNS